MAETGNWNGHVFTVSPTLIRGFTGLTVKGASETSTKTSSKQQYLARKAGKPVEVSITVDLHASLGCNVRDEALAFVTEARDGKKNYFYVGNKKLVPCQLMLVEASIDETEIAPNGTWVYARVKLTMKQASKNDGTKSSSSSSSKKKTSKKTSVKKKTSTTKTKTSSIASKVASVVSTVGKVVSSIAKSSALKKAQTAIKKIVSAAKAASKSKVTKPSTTKKGLTK